MAVATPIPQLSFELFWGGSFTRASAVWGIGTLGFGYLVRGALDFRLRALGFRV